MIEYAIIGGILYILADTANAGYYYVKFMNIINTYGSSGKNDIKKIKFRRTGPISAFTKRYLND